MENIQMTLTPDEEAILRGEQGETLRKVMQSVVMYGEAFGAEKLVPIQGSPHVVTSFGANTIKPYFAMMSELIDAGLTTQQPFTVDPRPMDFENLDPGWLRRLSFQLIFGKQEEYERQLEALGLKNENAFSCACYLPEVGNQPGLGDNLAWSESSAVVYANSVLGARTNRNSAGIDVMCDIVGKAPYFGLLTEEGRRATWKVEVRTTNLPNAQLLGSAIGIRVMEDVPYITGLAPFLGHGLNPATEAYLKDMGAATASNGAVGLYHVEKITPEAALQGESLLAEGYQTYVVDDAELKKVLDHYPVLWKDQNARPRMAFIGCPHLSLPQLKEWSTRIETALREAGKSRAEVPAYLFTAPDVADVFRQDAERIETLRGKNIRVTTICPLMYMNNPLCGRDPIVTSSNKLRTYTSARFYLEQELLQIIVSGTLPQGGEA